MQSHQIFQVKLEGYTEILKLYIVLSTDFGEKKVFLKYEYYENDLDDTNICQQKFTKTSKLEHITFLLLQVCKINMRTYHYGYEQHLNNYACVIVHQSKLQK